MGFSYKTYTFSFPVEPMRIFSRNASAMLASTNPGPGAFYVFVSGISIGDKQVLLVDGPLQTSSFLLAVAVDLLKDITRFISPEGFFCP